MSNTCIKCGQNILDKATVFDFMLIDDIGLKLFEVSKVTVRTSHLVTGKDTVICCSLQCARAYCYSIIDDFLGELRPPIGRKNIVN